ncbi:hypothetical protein [Glycomyces tarimensis]
MIDFPTIGTNLESSELSELSDRERRRIAARIGLGIAVAALALAALGMYVAHRPDAGGVLLALAIICAGIAIAWTQRCSSRHEHHHLELQHLALLEAARDIQASVDAERVQHQQILGQVAELIESALSDFASKVEDRQRDEQVRRARALIAENLDEMPSPTPPPVQLYSMSSPTPAGGIRKPTRVPRHLPRNGEAD